MNRIPAPFRRPARDARRADSAFTLIELLAVMTIILLLAGLILSIAGNAQYKAAMSRADSEIKAMETACASYKADNGTYPRNSDTDNLNAQANPPPDPSACVAASKYLFQQLSGNTQWSTGATNTTPTKSYITFVPNQLMNSDGTQPSAGLNNSTYVIDPFGFSYGYSTANQAAQDTANTANSTTPPPSPAATPDPTKGYNPTFDLWSTAGYASGGKSYSSTGLAATSYNTLWRKNW